MKTFLLCLLVLLALCGAQKHSGSDEILLQAGESEEEKAQTLRPRAEAEGGEKELVPQSDIWAELRDLRVMVIEHGVELRHLTARVTTAESLVEKLQKNNTAMEARMTAAESLAEELQMEHDAQGMELAVTQQKFVSLQQRLTANEDQVKELEKQQKVRKLAFSASLLASGEGNTEYKEVLQLIYRNVITNIGNHYNPYTGYFTAPVRGVYYFRFTGHVAHSNASMRMGLVKNGHLMVTSGDRHTTSADSEDNASNGTVLQLEVGDVVSVQLAGNVWDDQYHRTTFSGFLLFDF